MTGQATGVTLTIDLGSDLPPFEQLRRQLVQQITERTLPAGTRLPPVRRAAADLGLAPNTVARAYRELESEGYVVTRGRNGTVVAPVAPPDARTRHRADELTSDYADAMRRLGFDADATLRALRRALDG